MLALFAAQAVLAQTAFQRGAQAQRGADASDVERGHVRGRLTGIRRITGSSEKTAVLTIESQDKRTTTVSLREATNVDVRYTDLTSKKALPFLSVGVQVGVDWTSLRNPAAGHDGRFADRIEIQAEEIQGLVQSVSEAGTTVLAQPRKKTRYERDYEGGGGPGIRVEGRDSKRTEMPSKAAPPPEPRKLKLTFARDITTFSLEGKSTAVADIVKAAGDKRKKFRFEAVVVAGGPNAVVEMHVREGEEKKQDYDEPGNRRSTRPSKL